MTDDAAKTIDNPAEKPSSLKVNSFLVPPIARALEAVVMALGAAKYGPFNWRQKPIKASTYIAKIQRHLDQWTDGDDDDPESLVSHLAHLRADAGIMLDAQKTGNLIDDRVKGAGISKFFDWYRSKHTEVEN